MVKCSYCGKSSSCERTNHRFPLSDPAVLKKWLKNMKVDDSWTPTVHSRLCSDHFLNNCYKTNPGSSRRTLGKGSVPTVFTETQKKCAYCKVSKSHGPVKKSFHRFPLSGPKTLEKWLSNMAIKDWYPTEESRLCSDHFEPSCLYSYQGNLRLRDGSIPSIFSTQSSGDAASISDTAPEASHLTVVTESDQRSLQQPTNVEDAGNKLLDEVDVDAELAIDSSESLVTCPKCNHTFDPEGFSENLKRQASSNENCPKRLCTDEQMDRGEISVSTVEIGFSSPCKESEPTAISQRSEPNVYGKRKLMAHDHNYEISPHSTERKLQSFRESNKKLRHGLRIEQQRCNRMKRKISSLQEAMGELRRNRILPENSLDCLDTIAENDVNVFMKKR